jgi:hypothetical protein
MAINTAKNDPWYDENFQANEGPADTADQFSQVDSPAAGLRGFIERETYARAGSSGTSEVLVRGKIFMKQLPHGEFELLIYRGRNTYDAYFADTRDELIRFAESLQEGD